MDTDLSKMAADLKAPENPDTDEALAADVEEAVAAAPMGEAGIVAAAMEERTRALQPDGNPPPNEVVDTRPEIDEDLLPPEPEEKEYHVYHCARDNMRMHTPDGQEIRFTHKRHITDNPKHIEYLDSEVEAGNIFISVDKEKPVVTSSDLDPMAALKRKHIKEFLAEQAAQAAANAPRDMGVYETSTDGGKPQVKVRIPSSADIAAVSADSGK